MPDALIVGRQRLAIFRTAGLITLVEAVSGAAVWILLLSFAAAYDIQEYSKLLPWVACQQLIIVLAPFGASNALSKLINQREAGNVLELYAYIPRYVFINLLFAVPLAWGLTWVATRNSFAVPSVIDALLVIATGAWSAAQRTQQQLRVLTGRSATYTGERVVAGLTHVLVGLGLAHWQFQSMTAFFGGQIFGLLGVEFMRVVKGRAQVALPSRSLYTLFFKQSWVFGAWSVFGWFSGLGATILLTRTTPPTEIAVYGQAVAAVSLMSLALGGAATATQASLMERGMDWSESIKRRLDSFYNRSFLIMAGFTTLATVTRLEGFTIIHSVGLAWPGYIWFYFYITYASLTLYQRVILRYQYDATVSLSWHTVAVGELLAITAFSFGLKANPEEPLWASAALFTARCVNLFIFTAPGERSAWNAKLTTLAVATGLGLIVFSFWSNQ